MLGLWIALGIVGVLLLYGILVFNQLVRHRNRVENAWSGIDVQLKRRYDLIPNLIEAVKGYATHERELFEQVTQARTRAIEAGSVGDQAQAETEITRSLGRLLAVAEAYPQLRANENFLALQEELTSTESKIAFARQFYNDQVMRFNTLIEQFPSLIVARMGRFRQREFFEAEEDSRGAVAVDL
ncbi:MAG TPA: LemA family protein [Actinomycetota bacterium]|nr:LemA family protein [Actinomycetota bacterium]